ncbi:hypothetical protein [Sphingomonas taxi]|uniref:hypothetical protein n=1 Tax=Sphingomonas taxi TaxID=1549858 RepID=UPI0012E0504B|nr:hypothetical protein [Sphingomonas taxi]
MMADAAVALLFSGAGTLTLGEVCKVRNARTVGMMMLLVGCAMTMAELALS